MRRRLSFAALCLAWLCANGAIWNVVQVVAWGKMIRTYAEVMPLGRAIQVAFDGSAPCDLCAIADAGRSTPLEKFPSATAEKTQGKILLASPPAHAVVLASPEDLWPQPRGCTGPYRVKTVPTRPPRV